LHTQVLTDRYLDGSDTTYRNSLSLGLSWRLFYDLMLTLDYNRVAYTDTIFSPVGSKIVNRVFLNITKAADRAASYFR